MIYKIKRFSKVIITKTRKEGRGPAIKDIEELTDEQLYNLSKYANYSKESKPYKNSIKNYKKLGRISALTGFMCGLAKNSPVKGTVIGAGIGYGLGALAHQYHLKTSKDAEKELKKRKSGK